LNRTKVELKFLIPYGFNLMSNSLNRTKVELK